ncbi:hypothetical protein [Klebsiella grimontii]|uniref:hypothetical protein n=1 Tax=Klebsiella grimontii TaxID=2058152 RepID=UPI001F153C63|nr:hypothetical protein [Klebsiella grimontii]
MTTDITELAQSMKAAATNVKETAHIARYLKATIARQTFKELMTPENILALVEALEKAQQAININNQWKPDVCPITGRRFFLWIEHPELGYVPTYGGPYDSYTIPTRDSDGEFSCERYDHDFGGWVDGECVGAYLIDDDEQCRVYELEQRIAELESRTVKLPKPHAHLIWIQAGHAPDDYWDDVAVSHSEKDRCCDGSERYPVYARWEIEGMLTAAGIKWEAE